MVISYFGMGFVKASVGDFSLAFSPIGKGSKVKCVSMGADVALLGRNDDAYNGAELMKYGSKEPIVIDGPGEYEVREVFIKGLGVNSEATPVTVYSVMFDDIHLCHMGPIASSDLTPAQIEDLGEIDILFIPTYDGDTLGPKEANKLANKLNAKLVVPLYFDGSDSSLGEFFKESGEDVVKPVDKLTVKKKDLLEMTGDIVPIKSFS